MPGFLELFVRQPFPKCFSMDPSIMRRYGIEVTRIIQYQGQAVITMPNSFHCGFNTGFNSAVAINFGAPGWVDFQTKYSVDNS